MDKAKGNGKRQERRGLGRKGVTGEAGGKRMRGRHGEDRTIVERGRRRGKSRPHSHF